MEKDFYYAILTGWSILLFFWTIIVIFIFLRKPAKSKLTLSLCVKSFLVFLLGYIIIILLI